MPNAAARPSTSRWPITLVRWSLSLTSALMFGQAVSAGLFMGGVPGTFDLHREMATVSGVALMISIVATVVARLASRAPRWPIAASIGLLGLMSLQAFAGFRSLVALHVPLGVLVIMLTIAVAAWSWRWPTHRELPVATPRFAPGPVDERPEFTTPSR